MMALQQIVWDLWRVGPAAWFFPQGTMGWFKGEALRGVDAVSAVVCELHVGGGVTMADSVAAATSSVNLGDIASLYARHEAPIGSGVFSHIPSDTAAVYGLFPDGAITDSLGRPLADSLAQHLGGALDPTPAIDTMAVSAGDMFGPFSSLTETVVSSAGPVASLTENFVFKCAVLLCFAMYCMVIYYFRQQVVTAMNIFRSKLYMEILFEANSYTFESFLNVSVVMGMLAESLMIIGAVDMFAGPDIASALSQWAVPALLPAVFFVIMAMGLYQAAMSRLVGNLIMDRGFITRLMYVVRIVFTVFGLILTPLVLMFVMADHGNTPLLLMIVGAGVIGGFIFESVRLYMLFVDEKISKLYWFLYLCAIEIFPLTLVVFLIMKYLF